MSETSQTNSGSVSAMDEERRIVSWRKFYVHLSEKTNDAHLPWVSRFESIGQVKVDSPEDSDYILLFCPIASRVGTDISDALESIPAGDKEVILVVMHHTFNKDHVVADSRWQVSNPKVLLIVDTLFFEGRPLQSKHNEIAWDEIKKFLGVCAEVPSRGFSDYCMAVLQLVWAVILLMITWIRRLCERCFGNMEEERPRVPWRKFYVHLSGRTNDTHLPWVSRFVGIGQVKVVSPEDSDYILLFCPIASRVGTDISEALESIPAGDKEVILVVMHHTFNKDHVVADSRRQVSNPKVLLVVDTLFFEERPLQSKHNEIAWDEIKKFLGVCAEVPSRGFSDYCMAVLQLVWAVILLMITWIRRLCERCFGNMEEERPRVPWRKFYVHLSGRTNDTHLPWVSRFVGIGQVKVVSPEDSDYILLFCPIASRVGTDISEALESIPAGDKEVILVVMHHTFNKDHVVADSRRQVSNPKVLLVVDTLFFEERPLQSKHNEIAWDEIKKFLGVCAEVPSRGFSDYCMAVLQLVWAVILLMITWIRRLCERCFGNMEEERPRVPWRKFYVHLSGRTNDAHLPWVSRFVGIGQVKVVSPEDSDYILLFCPIASRVGTDISEALESIPAGDKEVILVVMHHTFNKDHIVADSRRQVNNTNVRLVVDTLFFEGRPLESNLNEIAWDDIKTFFGVRGHAKV